MQTLLIIKLEDSRQSLQGGGLPLADLVRMDAVLRSDLSQGFVLAQYLLDDLRLECGGVNFTGCHTVSLSSAHLILAAFTV